MAKNYGFDRTSLMVQGTDDVDVPQEVLDYFAGKGMSMKFLREHYGLGRHLVIVPPKPTRAQMVGAD